MTRKSAPLSRRWGGETVAQGVGPVMVLAMPAARAYFWLSTQIVWTERLARVVERRLRRGSRRG